MAELREMALCLCQPAAVLPLCFASGTSVNGGITSMVAFAIVNGKSNRKTGVQPDSVSRCGAFAPRRGEVRGGTRNEKARVGCVV